MTSRRQAIVALLSLVLFPRKRSIAATPLPSIQKRQFLVPRVDDSGRITSRFDASAIYFAEDLGAGVSLEMGLVPGGAFNMGSASNELIPPSNMMEQPVHSVSIRPFSLGVYPVTKAQWRRVSGFPRISTDLHPISSTGLAPELEDRLPADLIFNAEAVEFCQRLQSYTGRAYRLPSEAEWEYACRAGTTTKYHFGDGISLDVANFNDGLTRPLALTPVGSKQAPNRYGLFDMHGNVLEWCADWSHPNYDGAPTDGSPWTNGSDSSSRVGRGGSYLFGADSARSGARYHDDIRGSFSGHGLRVALDMPVSVLDPRPAGITNAASEAGGPVAPGEIVCIRGTNIGPVNAASLRLDDRGLVANELSGIRILFDGIAAPLLYISAVQVNAIVPYEVASKASILMTVESQGQTSEPVTLAVAQSNPALFTIDASGRGQGAILNQDGSLNSATKPAQRGTVVTLYATGEGQTNPPGVNGKLADGLTPIPVLPVMLFIGGVKADIQYVGGAPGQVAGLLKIDAMIPDAVGSGLQPVSLQVGDVSSPAGVVIAIA